MRIVTTVKHWQIFATVFGIGLFEELFVDERNELLSDIISLVWIVIYIGWILVLGSVLFGLKTPLYRTAYLVFITSGVVLISTVATVTLLTEDTEISEIMEQRPLFHWGYTIIALLFISIINSFPVRLLKIIETDDSVDINDYFGDIFLLVFWPVGIWFIQPRLNRLNLK